LHFTFGILNYFQKLGKIWIHTFKIPERKNISGYQRLPDLQEALLECDSEEGELSKPTPTRTSKTAQVKSLIMKI